VQATIPLGTLAGSSVTGQYVPSAQPVTDKGKRFCTGNQIAVVLILIGTGLVFLFLCADAGSILNAVESLDTLTTCFVPALIALAAVAWDWDQLGPTVAVKQCAMAALLAWVFVVVVALLPLAESLLALILLLAGVIVAVALCCAFGPPGYLAGLFALFIFFACGSLVRWLAEGTQGHTFLFALVFWFVRLYMKVGIPQFRDPKSWPYTTELDPESEEYNIQKDFFVASCIPWEHKYDFDLVVKAIWRIDQPKPTELPAPRVATGSRRLFHGTQWESDMGITCDGFRLPTHPGMFGKGIYFADCPLRCWQYCFPIKQLAYMLRKMTHRGGFVFMVWVDLGKTREEHKATPALGAYNHKSWRAWWTRQRGAYDSVTGLTQEDGGALRVPEYIIYDPKQARLAYLFEVESRQRARYQAGGRQRV